MESNPLEAERPHTQPPVPLPERLTSHPWGFEGLGGLLWTAHPALKKGHPPVAQRRPDRKLHDSTVDERSDRLPPHRPLQAIRLPQIEDDDRQVVIHA